MAMLCYATVLPSFPSQQMGAWPSRLWKGRRRARRASRLVYGLAFEAMVKAGSWLDEEKRGEEGIRQDREFATEMGMLRVRI
ncbi:hypothetical protein BZA77DRAFT_361628 [Pyronema omphalodes]|nr:hypothetical protein BZA77DRAFT_361628 [Pyronema omphalodes]